jgi:hypothetical protein
MNLQKEKPIYEGRDGCAEGFVRAAGILKKSISHLMEIYFL